MPLFPISNISMNSNGSKLAKSKKWEEYIKNSVYVRNMENTFHKFGKFHKNVLQLYMCNLLIISGIWIHYIFVLSKKAQIIKLENGMEVNAK